VEGKDNNAKKFQFTIFNFQSIFNKKFSNTNDVLVFEKYKNMQRFISQFSISIVSTLYLLFSELPLLDREISLSISPPDAAFLELKRQIIYFILLLLIAEILVYFSPSEIKKQADVFLFKLVVYLGNGAVALILFMRLLNL
jgi:hypothetical protein